MHGRTRSGAACGAPARECATGIGQAAVAADIDGRDDLGGVYDSTTATDYKHCGCKYEDPRREELSHQSYEWTRANASAATKRWLGALPFRIDIRPLGGHARWAVRESELPDDFAEYLETGGMP